MKRLAAIAALTLLAGCVTPEEQRAMDQDQCGGYGFRYGTDEFARCMQRTDINRAAEQRESMRDMQNQMERDRRYEEWQRRQDARDRRLDKYLSEN